MLEAFEKMLEAFEKMLEAFEKMLEAFEKKLEAFEKKLDILNIITDSEIGETQRLGSRPRSRPKSTD
jgi:hypothetical protein